MKGILREYVAGRGMTTIVDRVMKLQVRATDDLSGVFNLTAGLTGPDGRMNVDLGNGRVRLVSGTVNDGVWELTGTVLACSAVGQYTLNYLDASDRLGHRQSISTLNTPAFTLTGAAA